MKQIIAATMLLFLLNLAAAPAAAEEWNYDFVLYGWLTGLDGTIGVANLAGQPVDASFSDLASYVDFAAAGHFEARQQVFRIVADVAYFNLGSERDATVQNQPVTIDMDLQEWILEGGGGYRVTPEVDMLVVGRWYVFDTGATSTSILGEDVRTNNENWGDIYVGMRYMKTLKEKWLFSARGDIGAGGSDLAWFGDVALGYRFSPLLSAGLAWRVLSLDREANPASADYFKYDMTQDGVGIGLGISF